MRRESRLWAVVGAGALAAGAPLAAQTCLALPELNDFRAVVASGRVGLFEGGHTFTGWGTFGGDGFFLGGYHYTDLVGVTDAQESVEGGLGATVLRENGVSACLLGTIDYRLGLAEGERSFDLLPAVAVAYDDLLPQHPVSLTPLALLGVRYRRFTDENDSLRDLKRTDGWLEAGIGLVGPRGRFGIRPTVFLIKQGSDVSAIWRINLSLAAGTIPAPRPRARPRGAPPPAPPPTRPPS